MFNPHKHLKSIGAILLSIGMSFCVLGFNPMMTLAEETPTSTASVSLSEDKTEATIVIEAVPEEGYALSQITTVNQVEEKDPTTFVVEANGTYTFSLHFEPLPQEEVENVEETSLPEVTQEIEIEEMQEASPEATPEVIPEENPEEPTATPEEETGFVFFYDAYAEETSYEETVTVEVTGIETASSEEEPSIMPMSNEFLVTYDLGSEGVFAANGSNTISFPFDAGNTLNLYQIGYPIGAVSTPAGNYTTSGSVISSTAALLYYCDDNGQAIGPDYVPTQDITAHAYWVKDTDGDGFPDGMVKTYYLQTSNTAAFNTIPTLFPTLDPSTTARQSNKLTDQGNGVLKIEVTGIALNSYTSAYMHYLQWFFHNDLYGTEAIRSNPAVAGSTSSLAHAYAEFRAYIECDKSLQNIIDALPTATATGTIVSWEKAGTTLSASEVMSDNDGQRTSTYIAHYGDNYTVTYNLGTEGVFASNGSNTLSKQVELGSTFGQADYTYGTPVSAPGAYASTGTILSNHAFVLYWEDEAGNLVTYLDTVTRDTTLTAIWVSDRNGDGIFDEAQQTYNLETNDHGTLTGTVSLKAANYGSISTYSDAAGYNAYHIVGNFITVQGTTPSIYNQIIGFLSLRDNATYATLMKNRIAPVVAAIKMDKPLTTIISGLPTETGDAGYAFEAWEHQGTTYTDQEILDLIPTSSTVTYQANFELIPQCTVTYHMGTEGTFADSSTTKSVTNNCGVNLNQFDYTLGTPVTTAGAFATTGTVLSSSAVLLYWVDDQQQLMGIKDTVNEDVDLYAYWIKDDDGDGFVDGAIQSYLLSTNDHGTLTSIPTSAIVGSTAVSTVTSGVDAAGYPNVSIETNYLYVQGLTPATYPQLLTYFPLRTNDHYASAMQALIQKIVDAVAMDKPLSQAVDGLPTSVADALYQEGSWVTNGVVVDPMNAHPSSSLVEYQLQFNLIPVPTPTPVASATPAVGRTCQDDGYPAGYYWNGTACVIDAAPAVAVVPAPAVNPNNFVAPAATPSAETTPVVTPNASEPTVVETTNEPEVSLDSLQQPSYGTETNSWALMNLLAAGVSFVLGLFLILSKKEKEEEEEDEYGRPLLDSDGNPLLRTFERNPFYKGLGPILGLASVLVFMFTESFQNPMVLVDQWTILMLALLVCSIASVLLGRRWNANDSEKE